MSTTSSAHALPQEDSATPMRPVIITGLSGGGLSGLFSTHPSTEERVARLMAMAQGRGTRTAY